VEADAIHVPAPAIPGAMANTLVGFHSMKLWKA
jgi:hypothetical protein